MKLNVKLLPPYVKRGEQDEYTLQLDVQSIDLQQLAYYMAREWKDKLSYEILDKNKILTAEFMVNGKHVSVETVLQDGDSITVIPYICGG